MLKPNLILLSTFAILVLLQSCSKDDAPGPTPPTNGHKLAAVEWNSGFQREAYEYNSNNTLKRIVYSTGQTIDSYEFTWNGNSVSEMYEKTSLYKNFYYYNGGKITHVTNSLKNDPAKSFYKMEYTYKPDGKLDKLKYFLINDAGTELKAGTTYHYNTAGELSSSVTIMDEYTITQVIEGYSQPVEFNRWGFIDLSLLENYMIYNYPVLSAMKGIPSKVTRKVRIGNNPEFIDIVTTNTCEISNNRLNKMTIEMKVPNSPSLDRTRIAKFTYQ